MGHVIIDLNDIFTKSYGIGYINSLPGITLLKLKLKWFTCFRIQFFLDSLHDFVSDSRSKTIIMKSNVKWNEYCDVFINTQLLSMIDYLAKTFENYPLASVSINDENHRNLYNYLSEIMDDVYSKEILDILFKHYNVGNRENIDTRKVVEYLWSTKKKDEENNVENMKILSLKCVYAMGIKQTSYNKHLETRGFNGLDIPKNSYLAQFSTTQLIRLNTKQISPLGDNSFYKNGLKNPLYVTVDALGSNRQFQYVINYIRDNFEGNSIKLIYSPATYLDAASTNNGFYKHFLENYGQGIKLNISGNIKFTLNFTIDQARTIDNIISFGYYGGGSKNEYKLYVYNYFGTSIFNITSGKQFNSGVLLRNTKNNIDLDSVLSYDNKQYGIINNIRSANGQNYVTNMYNILYMTSYKTLLDFSKIIFHYYNGINKNSTNNIFIGVDFIGCNISSIFNNTIIGKKDPRNNIYEHIYLNHYIRTILEQPGGLYHDDRKRNLNLLIKELFSDKDAREPIDFTMKNIINDDNSHYSSAAEILYNENNNTGTTEEEEVTSLETPKRKITAIRVIDSARPYISKRPKIGFGKRIRSKIKYSTKNTTKMPPKTNKKFIQTALSKMRKRGTLGLFKKWCIRHKLISASGTVTKKCINLAKKSPNLKIRRRAIFAQNIKAYQGARKGAKRKSTTRKVLKNKIPKSLKKLAKKYSVRLTTKRGYKSVQQIKKQIKLRMRK